MMYFKYFLILFFVSGCVSNRDFMKKEFVPVVEKQIVESSVMIAKDRKYKTVDTNDCGSSTVVLNDDKLERVTLSGLFTVDDFVRMLSSLLSRVLVCSGVMPLVQVEIDGLYTRSQIMSFMQAYCSNVGYTLVDDGLVLNLLNNSVVDVSNSSSRPNGSSTSAVLSVVASYVGVMTLNNISINALSGAVSGVYLLNIGRDVAVIGDYRSVKTAQMIIKSLDIDGAGEFLVDFVSVSNEVFSRYEMMIKDFGNRYSSVRVYKISDLCLIMIVGTKRAEIDTVKKIFDVMQSNIKPFLYFVNVKNRDIVSIEKLLKISFPAVKYVVDEDSNTFLMFDYVNYISVRDFVDLVDREDVQILVRLCVLDLQKRSEIDFGFDIKSNAGDLDILSSVRESVGLGVVGSYGKMQLMINYLKKNSKGRILSEPVVNMRNNSTCTYNFGQSIATLQTSQSTESSVVTSSQVVVYRDVGLRVTIKPKLCGDKILIDMTLENSSVLDTSGFSGSPDFATDSLKLSFLVKNGMATVISGLDRLTLESGKKGVIPYIISSLYRREIRREFVVFVQAETVSLVRDSENILKTFIE